MARLSAIDYRVMLIFGRYFARDASTKAISDAAEYIAAAANNEEKRALRIEFHEGVRNNARNEQHVAECMLLLDVLVRDLEKQNA